MAWPKGKPRSPETCAKISATHKERGICLKVRGRRPRVRPLQGTPERRLFDRIANLLGAAAAHAELRREHNERRL
jgi:hypothetical protein